MLGRFDKRRRSTFVGQAGSIVALILSIGLPAGAPMASGKVEETCPLGTGSGQHPVAVYEDEGFYRARNEPEVIVRGRLVPSSEPTGPADRPAPFRLIGADVDLPIYAVGEAEERLRRNVGKPVTACAKRIDLTGEGFGIELWIGTLRSEP